MWFENIKSYASRKQNLCSVFFDILRLQHDKHINNQKVIQFVKRNFAKYTNNNPNLSNECKLPKMPTRQLLLQLGKLCMYHVGNVQKCIFFQ